MVCSKNKETKHTNGCGIGAENYGRPTYDVFTGCLLYGVHDEDDKLLSLVVVVKVCKSQWKKKDYVAETHIKGERERKREREKNMINFKAVVRKRRDILACLYCVCMCVFCVYVCMCVCVCVCICV